MIQSGSSRGSNDAVEAIWTSLMPKSGLAESYNEDEDVMKLSLLLKSTQLVMTGLKHKQLSFVRDVKTLTDELQAVTRVKEKIENDAKTLQKELSSLKFELHRAEKKAKNFQKDAEAATSKLRQCQSTIHSEVENRLTTIFNACLQQNFKTITVQDMMTQMQEHQETDLQLAEHTSAEPPPAKVQRVADLTGKHKSAAENSPDKSLIFDTPDAKKRPTLLRKNLDKIDLAKPKRHLAEMITSATSSPDEIAPTPPSEKQESKKRGKGRNFLSIVAAEEGKEEEKAAIVYATDTQDITPIALHNKRPALTENIVIPETMNPEDCEEEVILQPCSKRGKENDGGHHLKKSPTGTINTKSLSTPQKNSVPRDLSPVLGSEKKKNGARPANTSLCSSAKKPRMKGSSFPEANGDVSYRKTGGGGMRKTIQQRIDGMMLNTSSKSNRSKSLSLSLNKSHKDISKCLDFKKEQDIKHLSEEEQMELALSRSRQENYSNLTDDSDATLFLPISPAPVTERSVQENRKSVVNSNQSSGGRDSGQYFEPLFVSTEKQDVTPRKWKERSNVQNETLQTQFNPPVASTEKQSDFRPPLPKTEKQSDFRPPLPKTEKQSDFRPPPPKAAEKQYGFRPPYASTQKDPMENSALNDFVELLQEENFDDDSPEPAENSYDHVPRDFVNRGKKKSERRNLPALECDQCERYFEAAFGDDEKARKTMVTKCSRHRDRGGGQRSRTPPGWWNPGWNSPQDANKPLEA